MKRDVSSSLRPAAAALAAATGPVVESLEFRRHLDASQFAVNVDFQPESTTTVPAGYVADIGRAYGTRSNGRTYGWTASLESQTRQRGVLSDQRYDTLIHTVGQAWEIAVPNGTYSVRVVSGDATSFDSVYRTSVEGVLTVNATPTSDNRWFEGTSNVTVNDGKLTVANAEGAVNNKLAFLEIRQLVGAAAQTVSITAPDRSASETGKNYGTFTITRDGGGDISQPLRVEFIVGGSATNGVDYGQTGTAVVIPAGQSSLTMTLKPIGDSIVEGTETVTLLLRDVGTYSLGASVSATVKIADGGSVAAEAPPAAPRALAGSATSPTSVQLTWGDRSNNETGFRIERRTGENGAWVRIANVGENVSSFTDTTAQPETAYGYRVRAFNAQGSSAFTTTSVTTPEVPFPTRIEWDRVANSPIPRAEANGVVFNGKLYVFGGLYTADDGRVLASKRSDVYDPATDKWTRIADQPEAMTHSPAIIVGDVIWFVGGYVGNHPGPGTRHVWKYDVSDNAWSRGPDLPASRGAGSGGVIGNTMYFFGGMNKERTEERGDLYSLDLTDPTAHWKTLSPLPNPRNHIGGIAIGGYLYAFGGQYGQEEAQDAQDDIHRYDPTTDTWELVANFPTGRSHITGAVFEYDGKVIILGGETGDAEPTRFVTMFDPSDNSLTELSRLPRIRSTTVAGALGDGRIIFATGNGIDATSDTWIGELSVP